MFCLKVFNFRTSLYYAERRPANRKPNNISQYTYSTHELQPFRQPYSNTTPIHTEPYKPRTNPRSERTEDNKTRDSIWKPSSLRQESSTFRGPTPAPLIYYCWQTAGVFLSLPSERPRCVRGPTFVYNVIKCDGKIQKARFRRERNLGHRERAGNCFWRTIIVVWEYAPRINGSVCA